LDWRLGPSVLPILSFAATRKAVAESYILSIADMSVVLAAQDLVEGRMLSSMWRRRRQVLDLGAGSVRVGCEGWPAARERSAIVAAREGARLQLALPLQPVEAPRFATSSSRW